VKEGWDDHKEWLVKLRSSLHQIVVKIHAQIFQKAEDGFLVFAQAIEQISGGTFLPLVLVLSRFSCQGADLW
jgi:hypothetical protein